MEALPLSWAELSLLPPAEPGVFAQCVLSGAKKDRL